MQSVFLKKINLQLDQKNLIQWYVENKRSLPWRNTQNPYRIWISEVMLQQTTVAAVIPYYQKFMQRFPTILELANANIDDVYEMWAGLGYYSRARNLHKAAILISTMKGFPQSYQQLLELPGFGPYTSRAVSSLAFGEKTGVLDGNVIRVLSRKYGIDSNWWQTEARHELQKIADELAQTEDVSDLNQGLMELGATVCTPKKVLCLMCPWVKTCRSHQENKISDRPKMRPRAEFEIWQWNFEIQIRKHKKNKAQQTEIFVIENSSTPFLKKNWLPPSTAKRVLKKPQKYHLQHGVTKYHIFCKIRVLKKSPRPKSSLDYGRWIPIHEIQKTNPTSLMKKIIGFISEK